MDDFREHLKEFLQEKELRYKVVDILVGIRIQYKLSQAELAKKLGTTQAVISRVENGSVNIGINFLQKVANTINKKLDINVA